MLAEAESPGPRPLSAPGFTGSRAAGVPRRPSSSHSAKRLSSSSSSVDRRSAIGEALARSVRKKEEQDSHSTLQLVLDIQKQEKRLQQEWELQEELQQQVNNWLATSKQEQQQQQREVAGVSLQYYHGIQQQQQQQQGHSSTQEQLVMQQQQEQGVRRATLSAASSAQSITLKRRHMSSQASSADTGCRHPESSRSLNASLNPSCKSRQHSQHSSRSSSAQGSLALSWSFGVQGAATAAGAAAAGTGAVQEGEGSGISLGFQGVELPRPWLQLSTAAAAPAPAGPVHVVKDHLDRLSVILASAIQSLEGDQEEIDHPQPQQQQQQQQEEKQGQHLHNRPATAPSEAMVVAGAGDGWQEQHSYSAPQSPIAAACGPTRDLVASDHRRAASCYSWQQPLLLQQEQLQPILLKSGKQQQQHHSEGSSSALRSPLSVNQQQPQQGPIMPGSHGSYQQQQHSTHSPPQCPCSPRSPRSPRKQQQHSHLALDLSPRALLLYQQQQHFGVHWATPSTAPQPSSDKLMERQHSLTGEGSMPPWSLPASVSQSLRGSAAGSFPAGLLQQLSAGSAAFGSAAAAPGGLQCHGLAPGGAPTGGAIGRAAAAAPAVEGRLFDGRECEVAFGSGSLKRYDSLSSVDSDNICLASDYLRQNWGSFIQPGKQQQCQQRQQQQHVLTGKSEGCLAWSLGNESGMGMVTPAVWSLSCGLAPAAGYEVSGATGGGGLQGLAGMPSVAAAGAAAAAAQKVGVKPIVAATTAEDDTSCWGEILPGWQQYGPMGLQKTLIDNPSVMLSNGAAAAAVSAGKSQEQLSASQVHASGASGRGHSSSSGSNNGGSSSCLHSSAAPAWSLPGVPSSNHAAAPACSRSPAAAVAGAAGVVFHQTCMAKSAEDSCRPRALSLSQLPSSFLHALLPSPSSASSPAIRTVVSACGDSGSELPGQPQAIAGASQAGAASACQVTNVAGRMQDNPTMQDVQFHQHRQQEEQQPEQVDSHYQQQVELQQQQQEEQRLQHDLMGFCQGYRAMPQKQQQQQQQQWAVLLHAEHHSPAAGVAAPGAYSSRSTPALREKAESMCSSPGSAVTGSFAGPFMPGFNKASHGKKRTINDDWMMLRSPGISSGGGAHLQHQVHHIQAAGGERAKGSPLATAAAVTAAQAAAGQGCLSTAVGTAGVVREKAPAAAGAVPCILLPGAAAGALHCRPSLAAGALPGSPSAAAAAAPGGSRLLRSNPLKAAGMVSSSVYAAVDGDGVAPASPTAAQVLATRRSKSSSLPYPKWPGTARDSRTSVAAPGLYLPPSSAASASAVAVAESVLPPAPAGSLPPPAPAAAVSSTVVGGSSSSSNGEGRCPSLGVEFICRQRRSPLGADSAAAVNSADVDTPTWNMPAAPALAVQVPPPSSPQAVQMPQGEQAVQLLLIGEGEEEVEEGCGHIIEATDWVGGCCISLDQDEGECGGVPGAAAAAATAAAGPGVAAGAAGDSMAKLACDVGNEGEEQEEEWLGGPASHPLTSSLNSTVGLEGSLRGTAAAPALGQKLQSARSAPLLEAVDETGATAAGGVRPEAEAEMPTRSFLPQSLLRSPRLAEAGWTGETMSATRTTAAAVLCSNAALQATAAAIPAAMGAAVHAPAGADDVGPMSYWPESLRNLLVRVPRPSCSLDHQPLEHAPAPAAGDGGGDVAAVAASAAASSSSPYPQSHMLQTFGTLTSTLGLSSGVEAARGPPFCADGAVEGADGAVGTGAAAVGWTYGGGGGATEGSDGPESYMLSSLGTSTMGTSTAGRDILQGLSHNGPSRCSQGMHALLDTQQLFYEDTDSMQRSSYRQGLQQPSWSNEEQQQEGLKASFRAAPVQQVDSANSSSSYPAAAAAQAWPTGAGKGAAGQAAWGEGRCPASPSLDAPLQGPQEMGHVGCPCHHQAGPTIPISPNACCPAQSPQHLPHALYNHTPASAAAYSKVGVIPGAGLVGAMDGRTSDLQKVLFGAAADMGDSNSNSSEDHNGLRRLAFLRALPALEASLGGKNSATQRLAEALENLPLAHPEVAAAAAAVVEAARRRQARAMLETMMMADLGDSDAAASACAAAAGCGGGGGGSWMLESSTAVAAAAAVQGLRQAVRMGHDMNQGLSVAPALLGGEGGVTSAVSAASPCCSPQGAVNWRGRVHYPTSPTLHHQQQQQQPPQQQGRGGGDAVLWPGGAGPQHISEAAGAAAGAAAEAIGRAMRSPYSLWRHFPLEGGERQSAAEAVAKAAEGVDAGDHGFERPQRLHSRSPSPAAVAARAPDPKLTGLGQPYCSSISCPAVSAENPKRFYIDNGVLMSPPFSPLAPHYHQLSQQGQGSGNGCTMLCSPPSSPGKGASPCFHSKGYDDLQDDRNDSSSRSASPAAAGVPTAVHYSSVTVYCCCCNGPSAAVPDGGAAAAAHGSAGAPASTGIDHSSQQPQHQCSYSGAFSGGVPADHALLCNPMECIGNGAGHGLAAIKTGTEKGTMATTGVGAGAAVSPSAVGAAGVRDLHGCTSPGRGSLNSSFKSIIPDYPYKRSTLSGFRDSSPGKKPLWEPCIGPGAGNAARISPGRRAAGNGNSNNRDMSPPGERGRDGSPMHRAGGSSSPRPWSPAGRALRDRDSGGGRNSFFGGGANGRVAGNKGREGSPLRGGKGAAGAGGGGGGGRDVGGVNSRQPSPNNGAREGFNGGGGQSSPVRSGREDSGNSPRKVSGEGRGWGRSNSPRGQQRDRSPARRRVAEMESSGPSLGAPVVLYSSTAMSKYPVKGQKLPAAPETAGQMREEWGEEGVGTAGIGRAFRVTGTIRGSLDFLPAAKQLMARKKGGLVMPEADVAWLSSPTGMVPGATAAAALVAAGGGEGAPLVNRTVPGVGRGVCRRLGLGRSIYDKSDEDEEGVMAVKQERQWPMAVGGSCLKELEPVVLLSKQQQQQQLAEQVGEQPAHQAKEQAMRRQAVAQTPLQMEEGTIGTKEYGIDSHLYDMEVAVLHQQHQQQQQQQHQHQQQQQEQQLVGKPCSSHAVDLEQQDGEEKQCQSDGQEDREQQLHQYSPKSPGKALAGDPFKLSTSPSARDAAVQPCSWEKVGQGGIVEGTVQEWQQKDATHHWEAQQDPVSYCEASEEEQQEQLEGQSSECSAFDGMECAGVSQQLHFSSAQQLLQQVKVQRQQQQQGQDTHQQQQEHQLKQERQQQQQQVMGVFVDYPDQHSHHHQQQQLEKEERPEQQQQQQSCTREAGVAEGQGQQQVPEQPQEQQHEVVAASPLTVLQAVAAIEAKRRSKASAPNDWAMQKQQQQAKVEMAEAGSASYCSSSSSQVRSDLVTVKAAVLSWALEVKSDDGMHDMEDSICDVGLMMTASEHSGFPYAEWEGRTYAEEGMGETNGGSCREAAVRGSVAGVRGSGAEGALFPGHTVNDEQQMGVEQMRSSSASFDSSSSVGLGDGWREPAAFESGALRLDESGEYLLLSRSREGFLDRCYSSSDTCSGRHLGDVAGVPLQHQLAQEEIRPGGRALGVVGQKTGGGNVAGVPARGVKGVLGAVGVAAVAAAGAVFKAGGGGGPGRRAVGGGNGLLPEVVLEVRSGQGSYGSHRGRSGVSTDGGEGGCCMGVGNPVAAGVVQAGEDRSVGAARAGTAAAAAAGVTADLDQVKCSRQIRASSGHFKQQQQQQQHLKSEVTDSSKH